MKQDLVILGLSVKEYLPYFFMLVVGFCVGWLFVLRTIKNENFNGALDKARYIFWGVGSSMLTTWISFEIINYYFHLPTSLVISISGGIGYIGAEVVSDYALRLLERKLGAKIDKGAPEK
ncbi:holin [Helicobacter sp. NHP19-003]|uniref:Holin n=1 Tax=Helicobacter gastrocanis TaxID=2849641 RepID=A0ABN6I3E6_9HELI|nr:holin [Helicobacter sp. NHP19-003]BCZ18066.1 holin [Helicobacter sp. NHP19-003]